MVLMGQDMAFDQGFIADSMLRVGFKSARSHTLNTDWGPMDLDIGRKQEPLTLAAFPEYLHSHLPLRGALS
jgi:hypothetical protein